ncbi:hypothetical protein NL676_020905 [Syzygium grande]|nr:hypothetical protein NL676_020905 [Syzygium grande]
MRLAHGQQDYSYSSRFDLSRGTKTVVEGESSREATSSGSLALSWSDQQLCHWVEIALAVGKAGSGLSWLQV